MKALLIGTDSVGSVIEVPDDEVGRLQVLQKAVGGYIEAVGDSTLTLYCNEEGKLDGLDVNPGATWLANVIQPDFVVYDVLVGPVVVLGRAGSGDCDVPQHIVDLYLSESASRNRTGDDG